MDSSPLERVIDLLDPADNRLYGMSTDEARARLAGGDPRSVLALEGSFALVAWGEGVEVRMARSLDRPLRYFLAKRVDGPALVVADRIDRIADWLRAEGLSDQFRPAYTRMVPAHHVTTIRLLGCPDPSPSYDRFFAPERNALRPDLDAIGTAYGAAMASEIAKWLRSAESTHPGAPIGVAFSGGLDSGAVFLVLEQVMRTMGLSPARLRAFTLSVGDGGADLAQARTFLERLDRGFYLEPIEVAPEEIDPVATVRLVEDYKPLDLESAAAMRALARGIRARHADWRFLVDGDGGDENLKDYPIAENPELTIRSVLNNTMLYQEGWGVGTFKHSATYSGGLSRAAARTFAPLAESGFEGFSPFTRPAVIAVAEAIPFIELTNWDVDRLYALKGEVLSRAVKSVTGLDLPVFEKRRFQHGVASPGAEFRGASESELRRAFESLWA